VHLKSRNSSIHSQLSPHSLNMNWRVIKPCDCYFQAVSGNDTILMGLTKERPVTGSDNFEVPAELPFRSAIQIRDRGHIRSALQNYFSQIPAISHYRSHLTTTLSTCAPSANVFERDASQGGLAPHRGQHWKYGCAPVLLWHNRK
jgi:hypothetical protein